MTINLTPGMRMHDIELTMPERFGARRKRHPQNRQVTRTYVIVGESRFL
jgi:hypothetical protein